MGQKGTRRYRSDGTADYASGVSLSPRGGYVFTGLTCRYIAPVGFCGPYCCYDYYIVETDSVGNSYGCNEMPLIINEFADVLPDTVTNYTVTNPVIATGNITLTDTLVALPQVFSVCSVGLPEIQPNYSYLTIKPNPAHSETTITSQNTKQPNGILYFYNAMGKLVQSNEWNDISCTVNVDTFAKGIYFLRLIKNNSVETGKLLVE